MKKPWMSKTRCHGGLALRRKLTDMGVSFTEHFCMTNGFYATRFEIKKPRGRGATEKIRKLDEL